MAKRYLLDIIYAILLGLAVVISLGLGISYIVLKNPAGVRNDIQRLNDFDSISYKVDSYYSLNKSLPTEMKQIEDSSKSYPAPYSPSFLLSPSYDYATGDGKSLFKDPRSKAYYTIENTSESGFDYALCTTFETSWETVQPYMDSYYKDGLTTVSPAEPDVYPYYKQTKPNYDFKKGKDCIEYQLRTQSRDLPGYY